MADSNLDHGVLNVPLAKRGNIDAQLDAYKAQQAKDKKAQAKLAAEQLRADRAAAKAALDALSDEHAEAMAANLGITVIAVWRELEKLAYWQPGKLLRSLAVTP